MKDNEHVVWELSKEDISVTDDVVTLKGKKFFHPYITGAAINEDTIKGNGYLGGIMLAQTSGQHYSGSTGLPAIEEEIFIIKDDAKDYWDNLKTWIKGSRVKVMETKIPNETFKLLFES